MFKSGVEINAREVDLTSITYLTSGFQGVSGSISVLSPTKLSLSFFIKTGKTLAAEDAHYFFSYLISSQVLFNSRACCLNKEKLKNISFLLTCIVCSF